LDFLHTYVAYCRTSSLLHATQHRLTHTWQ